MPTSPQLSIVTAVAHAHENVPAILAALQVERYPSVEFIFCHQAGDRETPDRIGESANVKVLVGSADALIPELWRDGVRAASGERVAFTTAHCVPAAAWVERLLQCELSDYVAAGGVIENDPNADARSWGIYLLRYSAVAPPLAPVETTGIAADNAIYRREEIIRHQDLLQLGFWEPSFHERFIAAGMKLRLVPELKVMHCNRYTTLLFMRQRRRHGRAFGLERVDRYGAGRRLALVVLWPAAPIIHFLKLATAIWGRPHLREHFAAALPWFVVFLLSWSIGEIQGYYAALVGQRYQ